MNQLSKHIQDSPLVRAAIKEAVHRYYYDRVLADDRDKRRWSEDEKESFEIASNLLPNLWNLMPNWRWVLLNIPKRYQADSDTNCVQAYSGPEHRMELDIKILLNESEI